MKTVNNWNPVVGSLLSILQHHGFEIVSTDNGDDKEVKHEGTPRQRRQACKAEVVAVDEARVYLTHPNVQKRLVLLIVLGNEPEETVADYSSCDLLDRAVTDFSKAWQGKRVPTRRQVLSTKNGLLYLDGRMLGAFSADREAREAGFQYAEQLVKHLQQKATA